MLEYLKDITPEDTQRVSELRKSNFENATPEDIEFYAEWTAKVRMQEEAFVNREAEMREEQQIRREAFAQQAQTAQKAIEALRDAAIEKLELVRNGK